MGGSKGVAAGSAAAVDDREDQGIGDRSSAEIEVEEFSKLQDWTAARHLHAVLMALRTRWGRRRSWRIRRGCGASIGRLLSQLELLHFGLQFLQACVLGFEAVKQ